MDHSLFNNPNQELSTYSPLGFLDPSWDELPLDLHDFSPINSDDSEESHHQETLPSDVPFSEAKACTHSITSEAPPNIANNNSPQLGSSKEIKEQGSKAVLNFPVEQVRKSLGELKCGFTDRCSPAEALKKTHSKRKPVSSKRKRKGLATKEVLVFEDLGAEYLEKTLELLRERYSLVSLYLRQPALAAAVFSFPI
ncbi:hypothetical protein OIU77_025980 [Salix suchowensis]|uniref:Uncharacterized protein n=1 Tax=Salix suchowensis TaxID=1278906 RepID=A0ABQ9C181_9ROSI|nr:hypothetical protein OIU77_025980 [Salix suchowensis]